MSDRLNYMRLQHSATLLIRLCSNLDRIREIEADTNATPLLRGIGKCLAELNTLLLQTVITLLTNIMETQDRRAPRRPVCECPRCLGLYDDGAQEVDDVDGKLNGPRAGR